MTDHKTTPARRAKAASKPATEIPRRQRALRPEAVATPATEAAASPRTENDAASTSTGPAATPPAPKGPAGKLGVVVALMRRPEGATVTQMAETTGWQPHSVRGALAGALKRKHKLTIIGQPSESGRIYRIAAEQPA